MYQYASARRVQAGARDEPLYFIRTSGVTRGRRTTPPVGPRDPTPLARVPGHITPNREGRSSLYSLARVRRNLYLTTREGSRCKRAREEWM